MKRKVTFIALEDDEGNRDGEGGWAIEVDGQKIAEVDNDELDVSDHALAPLWKALDIDLEFDYD